MRPYLCRASRWPIVTIIALVLLTGSSLAPADVSAARPIDGTYVTGQILVKFRPGTPASDIAQIHRQYGGEELETLEGIDVQVVRIPPGQEHARVAAYQQNPNVEFAEVNGIWYADGAPNDPRVGTQWQYDNTGQTGGTADADIDAFEAWDITAGSQSVTIAILDTGIDAGHEDLAGKVVAARNFTTSSTVNDVHGHGTHVAGSASAVTNNAVGVAGACPSCSLMNVKVLGDTGGGQWDWIANGIRWAADNGAQVVNMSLSGDGGSQTVKSAVDYAWGRGVVIVAAAGNNGSDTPRYPAYYENVIAVAATDHHDVKASFSNYGSWVDVAAPGVSILSTTMGNSYASWNGTSMATPHVAGVAGLVWSTALCGPGDGACARARVEQTADAISGTGSLWQRGRVNACKAVDGTCDSSTSPPVVLIVAPASGTTLSGGTVTIQVSASDAEDAAGSLRTEISIDNSAWMLMDSDGTDIYTSTWNADEANTGVHAFNARTTDSSGLTTFTSQTLVRVSRVIALPGTFEVENYRPGGQQTGYYDKTPGNTGGAYWVDDVDIEQCSDPTTAAGQTCYNVGWIEHGEWLAYDISVEKAGYYTFSVRVATPNSGTSFHLELVDQNVSGSVAVPSTGGWQTWTTVSTNPISIAAGSYTLKVVANTGSNGYGFNLNYVSVSEVVTPTTLHVADLDGSTSVTGSKWKATVAITVRDTSGNLVSNATVSGRWSNSGSTVSCKTGSNGQCSITSAALTRSTSSVTFTVQNVTHSTLKYDATKNTDPDGDSNGTSITIQRP